MNNYFIKNMESELLLLESELTAEIKQGKSGFAKIYAELHNSKIINILDFEIDEVFVPTIYIEDNEDRSMMQDAFQKIDIAVTMEKTNINVCTQNSEINTSFNVGDRVQSILYSDKKGTVTKCNCENSCSVTYDNGVVNDFETKHTIKHLHKPEFALYAIGKKIDCSNREKYLLNIKNNVNVFNNLFQNLKTICSEITKITGVNNLLTNSSNPLFSKINFNIPSEENSIPTNEYIATGTKTYEQIVSSISTQRTSPPTINKSLSEFNVMPYNNFNPNNLMQFKFNDNKTSETSVLEMPTYYIYVNTHTFSTFVSTNNSYINVFDKNQEYGFQLLTLYKTNNNDIVQFINTMFNKKTFENKEEIENKLITTDKYIKFCEETKITNTETSEYNVVKNYVNHLYEIVTNDSDHKLKATEIFEIFEKKQEYLGLKVDTNFRNRLSKYLIQMGLQKKRFSDGYYYYGLIQRIL